MAFNYQLHQLLSMQSYITTMTSCTLCNAQCVLTKVMFASHFRITANPRVAVGWPAIPRMWWKPSITFANGWAQFDQYLIKHCKNKTPSDDFYFKFKEDKDSTWWWYVFWEHQWTFLRFQLFTITQMLTLHYHITDVLQWSWKTSIQQRTQLERKKIKPPFSIQIE